MLRRYISCSSCRSCFYFDSPCFVEDQKKGICTQLKKDLESKTGNGWFSTGEDSSLDVTDIDEVKVIAVVAMYKIKYPKILLELKP